MHVVLQCLYSWFKLFDNSSFVCSSEVTDTTVRSPRNISHVYKVMS